MSDGLEKLLVPQLKERLKALDPNAPTSGTKDALVARLREKLRLANAQPAPPVDIPADNQLPVSKAPIVTKVSPPTVPKFSPPTVAKMSPPLPKGVVLRPGLPPATKQPLTIPTQLQARPAIPVTVGGPTTPIVLKPAAPVVVPAAAGESEFTREQLQAMTIPNLKPLLKARGLPMTGTKAVLIDRLLGEASAAPAKKAAVKTPSVPGLTVVQARQAPSPSGTASADGAGAEAYMAMTNAQLKELLAARKLVKTGNKADLVKRLVDYDNGVSVPQGRGSPSRAPSLAQLGLRFVPMTAEDEDEDDIDVKGDTQDDESDVTSSDIDENEDIGEDFGDTGAPESPDDPKEPTSEDEEEEEEEDTGELDDE